VCAQQRKLARRWSDHPDQASGRMVTKHKQRTGDAELTGDGLQSQRVR
jgi:hypothetical protein